MSKEEQFINELIGYIFAYPDDDYMTMECLCRKLHKYGLIEKKDGEWTTDFIERKTESSSEKPNNCEHITEDGVTCAKYPACDDCLDNLLNKVKGSERLVKGSEQRVADRKTEPTISKMEQVDEPRLTPNYCGTCKHREVPCGDLPCDVCRNYSNYEPKDEPRKEQNFCGKCRYLYRDFKYGLSCYRLMDNEPCKYEERKDEPQTDCAWK